MIPSLRMRLKRLEKERLNKARAKGEPAKTEAPCDECVIGCLSDSELRELAGDYHQAAEELEAGEDPDEHNALFELAVKRRADLAYACFKCCGRCRYGAEHHRGWRPVLLEAGINPGGYPFRNLSLEEGLEQARFDLSIEPSPCGPERR